MKTFRFQIGNIGVRVKNPDSIKRIANRIYVTVGDRVLVIADNALAILSKDFAENLADYKVAKPVY